jgi:uncharacterized protein (TIGR02145 family)
LKFITKKIFMKKNLLLMMLCCPAMLVAQNGVTVSGLAIDAGTVTFNVSWKNTGMPALWSDTVWVFVDYNNKGVMERLPLLPGATLTATSPCGKVIEEPDNNKGVWVAGNARSAGSFSATVKLLTAIKDVGGACVYGSNYPPVGKYTSATEISFTGTSMYKIVLEEITSGSTLTAYSDGSYILPAGYAIQSFTDATGAPALMPGINQPQGSCTFTQPPVVGTFASFPSNYSASTYVTLTDTRDNKNYEVVKIGGRWIMARNLNYQKGLTWQSSSNQPFTSTTNGFPGIGNFWCPGGYSETATTSTRESCDVWGALYTWETAMSFDGKGDWTESPSTYNTGAANTAAAKANHGRTASGSGRGGRGICPPNWHVPTDNEWGIILDGMESDGGNAHQTAAGTGDYGINAGIRGRAKCTVTNNSTTGDTYVNDTQNNWYYDQRYLGEDVFGFRALPSGHRYADGSRYRRRGEYHYNWSSSVQTTKWGLNRNFYFLRGGAMRDVRERSNAIAVRCIRDE